MSDKPNNKQIEIMSISHLKLDLIKSPKLIPNISENDKTPSWDGSIEVYNRDNAKKEYLDGVVPIQVKGKFSDDLSFNSIKYSIEVNDLKNYQNNGGVVFFVILCNYEDFRIFYTSLLPFDIDLLLKDKNMQNTISVELDMLPNNEREVYLMLKDFIYHSKRQMQRDEHLQEMFLSGEIADLNPAFSFGYGARPYPNEEDTKEYMLTHPTYIYVKPQGFNIDVVLHKVSMESLNQEIPIPVIIDGQILYDSVMLQTLPHKKHVLKIGNNIDIAWDDLKFHFKAAPDIKTRINDLKIMTTMIQNKAILKGFGPIVEFGADAFEMCDNFSKHLNFLLDVQKVMDLFLVKKNLDLENMSDEDSKKLEALVRMVLYNEPTTYSFDGSEGIGFLKISNIKIIVLCKKSDKDGYYMVSNMFSENNIVVKCTVDNGDEISISPYMWCLQYEALITVDNINLDVVIQSIKSFERSEAYDSAVNKYALDLISAYDTTKNTDFLTAANTLLSFIISDEINTEGNAIYKINKMQTKKRNSDLSKDDKTELMQFKNLYTSNIMLIICINILLESYEEARMLYDTLSNEEKENFDTFPINHLWIKSEKINGGLV